MESTSKISPGEVRKAIDSNPFWYHTLEVAPGINTPGWFDLRPIVDKMPWPEIEGKRCLDVGTSNGFLAFELERRGASEVVAVDVSDHESWDWPSHIRARGVEYLHAEAGPDKALGLRTACELLDSSVKAMEVSAYDLTPEAVGEFDVVVCGSLLLHLRDPVRALEAIRSVCRGSFLCTNQIDPLLTVFGRKAPFGRFLGAGEYCQWWVPNPAGHRAMLESARWVIERESKPYAIPFGDAHRTRGAGARGRLRKLLRTVVAGGDGVPHHALLARPAD